MRFLIVSLLFASTPADATCAYIETVDLVIQASGPIATDGAVIIGHGPRAPNAVKHSPKAEDWKLVDGTGKPADVKLVELAPGIKAFVRTTPTQPRSKLVIKDSAGELGTFTYEDIKLTLAAPEGSNAKVTWSKGFRGGPHSTFEIDVKSVPDDAAYLIVTGANGSSSAVGAPHTQTGKATLIPHSSGGHCDSGSPGSPPGDGEAVTLVWMDRYGRKGPASKPIKAVHRR